MSTERELRTNIFGLRPDHEKGTTAAVGMWLGGGVMGGVTAHVTLTPEEAREIAAELIDAANLAEGGKA